jgi:ABC-type transport system involved in multi-copper enzyme maturation permease subunit
MRIEPDQMYSYFEWLFLHWGLLHGALVATVMAALGFFICYLVALKQHGPGEGFFVVTRVIYELIARDLPNTTGRRVYALARLAFQEAIRRRVLVVMAVFIVGLLFGGWFLDPGTDNVARLYISFVMTGTSYLVLLLGLFLSCFSLPSDIKNKTIHTIATKPVRSTEIVLGRILGFTAVGTMLLVSMGILSYVFVVRGSDHRHEITEVSADGAGKTSYDARHEHTFEMNTGGSGELVEGVTSEQKSHKHTVTSTVADDGKVVYAVGEPEGLLAARIPVFGKLRYTNRQGEDDTKGLNVGEESDYVAYIEGNSLMSGIWTFSGVSEARFGDSLPIEMNLKAFRTYKGDIVTGVQGEIFLRNTSKQIESERLPFIVREFAVDHKEIPRKLKGTVKGEPKDELDIYDDLAADGNLEVVIRCTDGGQYFGMAQPDLYLLAGESTFGWNLFKGFFGIWMQMVLIICIGVMFSTFLSGSVAMVATMTALVLGFCGNMVFDIANGKTPGGGPIESLIRMPMQSGAMVELDLGNRILETFIKKTDQGIMYTMYSLFNALPSFGSFNTSEYVAYGFDIFGGLVARHLTMTIGYFVLTSVIAYFFLKTREMAA